MGIGLVRTQEKEFQMKNMLNILADLGPEVIIKATKSRSSAELSLINQFALHSEIPNKWFDWTSKVDAPVMIIGQDWGPYSALLKYIEDFQTTVNNKDFNYHEYLMSVFSSRTEKSIVKSLEKTYKEHFKLEMPDSIWDQLFFTVAVFFTRKGKYFRGSDHFEPKQSLELSFPFLSKQIEIVQPQIIMPLGVMAYEQVAKHFNLQIPYKNLTDLLSKLPNQTIKAVDTIIIPNYHPAAHVPPTEITKRFGLVWEYLK